MSRAFDELLAELRTIPVDDRTREALVGLLREFAGQRVRISAGPIRQQERVRMAQRLLEAREPRPVIRERLVAAYRVSRSTADRDIVQAINARRPPRCETRA